MGHFLVNDRDLEDAGAPRPVRTAHAPRGPAGPCPPAALRWAVVSEGKFRGEENGDVIES